MRCHSAPFSAAEEHTLRGPDAGRAESATPRSAQVVLRLDLTPGRRGQLAYVPGECPMPALRPTRARARARARSPLTCHPCREPRARSESTRASTRSESTRASSHSECTESGVPSTDLKAASPWACGTCARRLRTSPLASVVRALRAPHAEAESELSAHERESIKPASAPSQACRAASRAGPGLCAERARGGERARVKPASCTEPGVPSTAPTAAGRGFLALGTGSWW